MATLRTTLGTLAVTAAVRAGAVLTGLVVTAGVAGAAWGAQDVVLTTRGASGGSLTVEGSIDGVRAGAPSAPLRLTLRNPGDRARDVTRVTAHVTGATGGPAACDGRHLRVGSWRGAVTVPAGGAATVTVPVALDGGLPAECHDVTWGLVYTAY